MPYPRPGRRHGRGVQRRIRARVERARAVQRERFQGPAGRVRQRPHGRARYPPPLRALSAGRAAAARRRQPAGALRAGVSPDPQDRAHHRGSRTGSRIPDTGHVSEAIQYRTLDRRRSPRDARCRAGGAGKSRMVCRSSTTGRRAGLVRPAAPLPLDRRRAAAWRPPGRPWRPSWVGCGLRCFGTARAPATTSRQALGHFLAVAELAARAARHEPQPARASSRVASRSSSRRRCSSVSDGEAATSHQTSTRVDEVFTCWPPGPPERDARIFQLREGSWRSGAMTSRWVASGMAKINRVATSHLVPDRITLLRHDRPRTLCGVTCSASDGSSWATRAGWTRPCSRWSAARRSARIASSPSSAGVPRIPRSSGAPPSSWPGGSTCRCSRWTPASWPIRATSGIPPTAATSARPSCGPGSARSPRARGFDTIIDGTNADDLGEHRPGLSAAEEHRVRSPLAELGWSKAAVRAASRALGLPDLGRARRPLPIEPGGLRARDHAGAASAGRGGRSVPALPRRHRRSPRAPPWRPRADRGGRPRSSTGFARPGTPSTARFSGLGFEEVELDPAGYRRGGLLALAPDRADAAVRRHPDRRSRAARKIIALLGRLRDGDWPVRWVHDEGLHLTLKFFGEVAPERLDVIEEAVRFAGQGTGPLDLRLDGLGAFPSLAAAAGALGRHRRAAGARAAA